MIITLRRPLPSGTQISDSFWKGKIGNTVEAVEIPQFKDLHILVGKWSEIHPVRCSSSVLYLASINFVSVASKILATTDTVHTTLAASWDETRSPDIRSAD
jgi:hypothetical protein